jgi:hypothetical protein
MVKVGSDCDCQMFYKDIQNIISILFVFYLHILLVQIIYELHFLVEIFEHKRRKHCNIWLFAVTTIYYSKNLDIIHKS